MRIIRAKYPKVGSKYVDYQGIGSLYGGNHESTVDNNNEERTDHYNMNHTAFTDDFSPSFD